MRIRTIVLVTVVGATGYAIGMSSDSDSARKARKRVKAWSSPATKKAKKRADKAGKRAKKLAKKLKKQLG